MKYLVVDFINSLLLILSIPPVALSTGVGFFWSTPSVKTAFHIQLAIPLDISRKKKQKRMDIDVQNGPTKILKLTYTGFMDINMCWKYLCKKKENYSFARLRDRRSDDVKEIRDKKGENLTLQWFANVVKWHIGCHRRTWPLGNKNVQICTSGWLRVDLQISH